MSEDHVLAARSGELDHEAGFYDHELDFNGEREVRAQGGSRPRSVSDWGGDELFVQMTRRRFQRATPTAPRRPGAAPTSASNPRRGGDQLSPAAGALSLNEAVDGSTPRVRPVHPVDLVRPALLTVIDDDDVNGAGALAPASQRHRRSRTLDERVGPRPDRIAAWAFALGLLLILLAVATADAAAVFAAT